MGKIISVSSFEDMAKASNRLQSLSDSYLEIHAQLMQEVTAISSVWEGADNLAFIEQINGLGEELRAMAAKLATASRALDKQRANYMARQDNNIAQVKKLAY